jgi:hypothetical protein
MRDKPLGPGERIISRRASGFADVYDKGSTLYLHDEEAWVTILAVWTGRDDRGVFTAYARVRASHPDEVQLR